MSEETVEWEYFVFAEKYEEEANVILRQLEFDAARSEQLARLQRQAEIYATLALVQEMRTQNGRLEQVIKKLDEISTSIMIVGGET